MLKKCYKNCGDRDRCQELLQKSILKRHDKKIAKTQKVHQGLGKFVIKKCICPQSEHGKSGWFGLHYCRIKGMDIELHFPSC